MESIASERSARMPAAEHSLIAFPDPWVSYLCHRCLRHYITLLYGGLKSRKRGPRFPLVSRSKYPLAGVATASSCVPNC